jgi:hypothetical protein
MMQNRHSKQQFSWLGSLLGSLAASHDYYLMENGRADALVVMLVMASPVHFTLLKKPEFNDSGFFCL